MGLRISLRDRLREENIFQEGGMPNMSVSFSNSIATFLEDVFFPKSITKRYPEKRSITTRYCVSPTKNWSRESRSIGSRFLCRMSSSVGNTTGWLFANSLHTGQFSMVFTTSSFIPGQKYLLFAARY